MEINQIKHEQQGLISGKSGSSYDALIQTTANYLRSGKKSSPMTEKNKTQETTVIIVF